VNTLAISNGGQNMLVAATGATMPNSTAATSNSWTANGVNWIATTNPSAVESPYKAFNNSFASSNNWIGQLNTWNASGAYTGTATTYITNLALTVPGEWVQLQTSVPLVLYSYSYGIGNIGTNHKSMYILGSNDGTTWYSLQYSVMTTNPFSTAFTAATTYLMMNYTGTQTITAATTQNVTTTAYSFTTLPFTYFRFHISSNFNTSIDAAQFGELYLNFQYGSTYLSTNYGSTWSTAATAPPTAPFLTTSGNGQYTITGSGQLATVYSNAALTTYTIPTLTGINANINCASVSSTGQYMIIMTQGTTNNVFYSTNYGTTFTAMTVGTLPMTSCAISYDGFEITVSNASNVYTLNRNTQGYSITMGNQAGLTNQGYNSVAIGNLAGVTNQSANSIILNASGSVLDAYNSGFFVSPIQPHNNGNTTSVNLLGYGADNQIVYTGPSVKTDGSFNPFVITSMDAGVTAGAALTLTNRIGSQVTFTNSLGQGFYNSIVQAGDFGIINRDFMNSTTAGYFTNSALATGGICIASHTNASAGLRVSPTGVQMNGTIILNGPVGVSGANVINFGYDLTKDGNAGKIGYGVFTTGVLDIVGGGAIGSSRTVKIWDNLLVGSKIGIGIANPTNTLHVQGNVTIGGSNCSIYWAGASDNYILTSMTDGFGAGSGTNNFVISSWYGLGFGNATNAHYATAYINCRTGTYYGVSALSSDKRMKKNIQLSTNCLDKINSIPVVSYDFIESHKPHVQYGIVAQDVRDTVPEAVSITSNFIGDSDKIVTHVLDGDIITITSPSHGYHTGNVLRFTIDYVNTIDDKFHTTSITVIDDDTYTIPTWNEYDSSASLYVYGKFVNDFHNVDASHFTFLALGGIKELIAENIQMKSQLASLEARLAALESK
jgi:hypothetical protein